MERSEPALAPEWLKASNRSNSSTGNSIPLHFDSSHSDDHGVGSSLRRISRSSSLTDRSSSSTYRRSNSSNGMHSRDKDNSTHSQPYSSFGRSNRDRDRERDTGHHSVRQKLSVLDNRRFGFSDPYTSFRTEKDILLRSPPMLSRKRHESCPIRTIDNARNGVLPVGGLTTGFPKASFERDFPSLGVEEKQGASDIVRVSSPGLTTAAQTLALDSSTIIGSEIWTSALVDVHPAIAGSAPIPSYVQQSAPVSFTSTVSSSCLNMAETLAQAPLRSRAGPQLSIESRKLEELVIKQSRQLIPVTPSMPKTLVNNSLDKLKPKGLRNGDITMLPKVVLQPSSQHTIHGPIRSDFPKPSQVGNFHVLNRERNGLSPTAKESPSPSNGGKAVNPSGDALPVSALKNDNSMKAKAENKTNFFTVAQVSAMERKPSSQTQNRNAFFNALRRKTLSNSSSANDQEQCPVSPTSVSDKLGEQASVDATFVSKAKETSASGLECLVAGNSGMNGSCCFENFEIFFPQKDDDDDSPCSDAIIPDEEAQFLRSLGWEENTGEEALTPEEIYAFLKEHEKLIPASKLLHLEIRQ